MSKIIQANKITDLENISLIVTCFNEGLSIEKWCRSFLKLSKLPNEVIIADANSSDDTVPQLKKYLKGYHGTLIILSGKCNISAGRNKAIRAANNKKIAITDFGIQFHPSWIENISLALNYNDWVGGVYEITWDNSIQRSYAKLFGLSAEKINEKVFLPSSRSFGLTKDTFALSGGYNESLFIGEDTELVLRLRSLSLKYSLIREAIVYWKPRASLSLIYLQHYKYAYWDGIAGQNRGRWLHILFITSIITIPVNSYFLFKFQGLIAGLLLSVFLVLCKTNINTARTKSGTPNLLDVIVYLSTVTGSCVGFAAGLIRKNV